MFLRSQKLQQCILLLIFLLFVAYGLYTTWLVFAAKSSLFLIWSVPCFIGVAGLLLAKPWSRFFVYAVAICTILGWLVYHLMLFGEGWPNYNFRQFAWWSLTSTLIIASLIGSCVYVHFYFKGLRNGAT